MHSVERAHLHEGRISLGRLALEAAMIAFGVLLALSAESWRERRQHRALADEALANIRVEMSAGTERIRQRLPRQLELDKALGAFIEGLDSGQHPAPPKLALYPAGLSAAAWNTAMSTQALVHMEFGTVRALASFYEQQPWLYRIEDVWLRLMTEPHASTLEGEKQWARSLQTTLRVYIEIEETALAAAERTQPGGPKE